MCACNGTGVIQNDIGTGMYQFASCICEAANQTHEEVGVLIDNEVSKGAETHVIEQGIRRRHSVSRSGGIIGIRTEK